MRRQALCTIDEGKHQASTKVETVRAPRATISRGTRYARGEWHQLRIGRFRGQRAWRTPGLVAELVPGAIRIANRDAAGRLAGHQCRATPPPGSADGVGEDIGRLCPSF